MQPARSVRGRRRKATVGEGSRAALRAWLSTYADRLLWVALAGAFLTLGLLPRLPRERVANYLAAWALLACAFMLMFRWVRRKLRERRQRQWRESAGRMNGETQAAPRPGRSADADLAAQVEQNTARIAEITARQEAGYERLNALSEGLVRTFAAAGRAAPEEVVAASAPVEEAPTTPLLRVIGGAGRARRTGT